MRRTQEEITRRELVTNLTDLAARVSLLEGSREPGGRHHHHN
jgi:hypothetical protein